MKKEGCVLCIVHRTIKDRANCKREINKDNAQLEKALKKGEVGNTPEAIARYLQDKIDKRIKQMEKEIIEAEEENRGRSRRRKGSV